MSIKSIQFLSIVFTASALGFAAGAWAKEKDPTISTNSTSFPQEFTMNIAKTAVAMGVKEPLIIAQDGSNAKISGSNATVCIAKLSTDAAPKMLGMSCK